MPDCAACPELHCLQAPASFVVTAGNVVGVVRGKVWQPKFSMIGGSVMSLGKRCKMGPEVLQKWVVLMLVTGSRSGAYLHQN